MANEFIINGAIIARMTSMIPAGSSGSGNLSISKKSCVQIRFYIKNIGSEYNSDGTTGKFLTVKTLQYRRFTGNFDPEYDYSDSSSISSSNFSFVDSEWLDATLIGSNKVQTKNEDVGFLNDIYWDVANDCPYENNTNYVMFRMEIEQDGTGTGYDKKVYRDSTGDKTTFYFSTQEESGWQVVPPYPAYSYASLLKTTSPYFLRDDGSYIIDTPAYVNNSSFNVDTKKYEETSDSGSSVQIDTMSYDAVYYSFKTSTGSWSDWASFNNGVMTVGFSPIEDVYDYSIQVKLADRFFNSLPTGDNGILSFVVSYDNSIPYDCSVNIYGTNGNTRYTGIIINSDGSFTPSRKVTVMFFGNSNLKLQCRLRSDNILIPTITTYLQNNVLHANVGSIPSVYDTGYFDYKATAGDNKVRPINEVECQIVGEDFNVSENRSIIVEFLDEAGNMNAIEANITFNNRIYKTSVRNIVDDGINYVPMIRKEGQAGSGAYVTISEAYESDEDAYIRNWNDIYYPETHGPKINPSTGSIDIDWAIAANRNNESSYDKENYDPVVMEANGTSIKYDDDGRVTTQWKEETGVSGGVNTKLYDNLVSSSAAVLKYWVIDNTGYGDISLTFEQFHMDINPGLPPYNSLSPYKGDCVVIYNADNENCLTPVKQPDGSIDYPVSGLNTNLMEVLSVFTGDSNNRSVIDYVTGDSVTMLSDGSFVAEYSFVNRICIVVYTNGNGQGTGFKIKGGPKQRLAYSNYNIDLNNGEVWIHEEANGGMAPDVGVGIRAYYSYYDSVVRYDNDNGRIIMNVSNVPEDAIVTADYSYYKKEEDKTEDDRTLLYLSTDDDYYDYLATSVYITPRYATLNKTGEQFDYDNYNSGKLSSTFYAVDTDRGCITIIDGGLNGKYYYCPVNARMTMDYVHHSYYRLSNDGYGDVTFQDSTIVAATTPVYRDVTWCDLMFVNEGDAIFENGSIRMTARGEINQSGEQTKLVDPNRPWDAQMGIADATFKKARIYRTSTYSNTETRDGAYIYSSNPTVADLRKIWNAAGDASGDGGVGLAGPNGYISPRESIYGRVIWSLGGSSGSGYPTDTAGKKCWGSVIRGVYYSLEV